MHRQEQNDKETIEEKTKSLHFYNSIQNSHSFLYYLVAAFINHLKWMKYDGWYGQKVLPEKNETASFFVGLDGIGSPANTYIYYTFYSC